MRIYVPQALAVTREPLLPLPPPWTYTCRSSLQFRLSEFVGRTGAKTLTHRDDADMTVEQPPKGIDATIVQQDARTPREGRDARAPQTATVPAQRSEPRDTERGRHEHGLLGAGKMRCDLAQRAKEWALLPSDDVWTTTEQADRLRYDGNVETMALGSAMKHLGTVEPRQPVKVHINATNTPSSDDVRVDHVEHSVMELEVLGLHANPHQLYRTIGRRLDRTSTEWWGRPRTGPGAHRTSTSRYFS